MEENPTCRYYTFFQNPHLALKKAFINTTRSTMQIEGIFYFYFKILYKIESINFNTILSKVNFFGYDFFLKFVTTLIFDKYVA
jgi:hypothetical protein